MGIVKSNLAISLDGFSSAPGQSREEPFGQGGGRLTEWMFETDLPGREADAKIRSGINADVGAYVMGRHMFGGYAGEWDLSWRGWWGEDPPYHTPVFVLTHHERAPLPMQGGTTFHFVTDGFAAAIEQAKAAAGDRKVHVSGGADIVQQALAAGLVDELHIHIAPVLLGQGTRLFDNLPDRMVELERFRTVDSADATHLSFRVVKKES
jgi:dihydrofolate reductase